MRCSKCKRQTRTEAFATYKDRKGQLRRRGICKECRGKYATENFDRLQKWRREYNQKNKDPKRERDRQRKADAKAFVDAFKARPCADCGKQWPPIAMDLDHVRGAKVKGVAMLVSGAYKLDLIKIELEKCEVVCACCHRIRTHSRRDNLAPSRETRTCGRPQRTPEAARQVPCSEAPCVSH